MTGLRLNTSQNCKLIGTSCQHVPPAFNVKQSPRVLGKNSEQPQANDVIDMHGPMVPQVHNLGSLYWAWVHRPSPQPSYRLFAGDLYEFFSRTPWWVIPLVWIPMTCLFAFDSLGKLDPSIQVIPRRFSPMGAEFLTLKAFSLVFFMGVLLWSLLEYCLHRFLFHIILFPKTKFGIQFHFILHGQHHKFPLDRGRLVFPPVAGILMMLPFLFFFQILLHRAMANALIAGALVGYMLYDLTHYYLHHGKPTSSYFRRLKEHHMQHHYRDPDHGFGISSKLWDSPFSTLFPGNEEAKQAE